MTYKPKNLNVLHRDFCFKPKNMNVTRRVEMKIPYGYYLNEENEVSIDPVKADAVIMIYDMYIEGISLRKISQKLSEKGYLSPSGKNSWSAQAIDNIVCNSKYVSIVSFEKFVAASFVKAAR